jgi:thymidine kinase
MAKLHYRYGVMGSGKSAQLSIIANNYIEVGQRPLLVKTAADTREATINSRIEVLSRTPDLVISPEVDLFEAIDTAGVDVVLVDEAQFMAPHQVDQLFLIAVERNVPVMCFGLRTDYQGNLWPASGRLFALAHDIQELKMVCHCGAKAIFTRRKSGADGLIVMGGSNDYDAMCAHHWLTEANYRHSLTDAYTGMIAAADRPAAS